MATKTIAVITTKCIILLIFINCVLVGNSADAQTGFEYYNVALVKYNIHDYEGALDDLARVIEHDPNNPQAFNLRGMVKHNLGDYSGAIEAYNRAIEIYNSMGKGIRIKVTSYRGNFIELPDNPNPNPDLAVPYFNRALAKNATKDYSGAIEDYTSALENDSEMVTSYINRGLVRYNIGDLSGACSDWRTALDEGLNQAEDLIRDHCR
jgi:tetratricopeptide (TPR) repeat protein